MIPLTGAREVEEPQGLVAHTALLRPLLPEPSSSQLIVCPFGGSSSGAFRRWRQLGRVGLSALLVTYPGRDHRMDESEIGSVGSIASELAECLVAAPFRGQRILVGHSLGAQIAFEACRLLEQAGCPPFGLVLSACHAPHLAPQRALSALTDDEFIEQLIRLGGSPVDLRTDLEFRQAYLPMLRRDFVVSEGYRRPLEEPVRLSTPTLLLHGSTDTEASEEDVWAWREWCSTPVELRVLSGDHFYITHDPRAFLVAVASKFDLNFVPRAEGATVASGDSHFP